MQPMTDDDSDDHSSGGTWYGRLRRVIKGDAATRDDLLDWLRQSHAQTVLDADELAMLEGVLAVSETQVRDVMVPRSQMAVLERDAPQGRAAEGDRGKRAFPLSRHRP